MSGQSSVSQNPFGTMNQTFVLSISGVICTSFRRYLTWLHHTQKQEKIHSILIEFLLFILFYMAKFNNTNRK